MNNFGHVRCLSCQTDSDSEAENNSSEVKHRKNCILMRFWRHCSSFWFKSASEDSVSLPRNQVEDSETRSSDEQSQLLMLSFWSSAEDTEDKKFWWTSPASEDLKILKTKCQRLWRPEVLMNVSRFQGLEVLKIKATRLILIKLRWSSNWSKSMVKVQVTGK